MLCSLHFSFESKNLFFTLLTILALVVVATAGRKDRTPDGYLIDKRSNHAYKLQYLAAIWPAANESCVRQGARLAVPRSTNEFMFIQQKIVRPMHYPDTIGANYPLLVWVGINNLRDINVWENVYGENIDKTGFHVWAGGVNDRPPSKETRCAGMDAHNFGYREWWCYLAQAYVCEKDV